VEDAGRNCRKGSSDAGFGRAETRNQNCRNNNGRLFKQYLQRDVWRECIYNCGMSAEYMYNVWCARV